MIEKHAILEHCFNLIMKVIGDVLNAADAMDGTIVAAAGFGGFCLCLYRVVSYYKNLDVDLISKEHVLAILLIIIAIVFLPIFGIAFAGLYGITNHIAAWQIGLTTPMIIESALIAYAKKAKEGTYHSQFLPDDDRA